IASKQFGAGKGLSELGTGVTSLAAAPLTGLGSGISSFSGGLTDFGESIGGLGRGFSTFFQSFQNIKLPTVGPQGSLSGQNYPVNPIYQNGSDLVPDGGGNNEQLLAGGGGNVSSSITSQAYAAQLRSVRR
ncbi:unnamed protein product, partial [marine sediment metagenome]